MSTPLIIVLAVVGFVVGSIFWILPSPAERRRMKLRQVAYSRGFRVKKQALNELHSSLEAESENATYYYFRLGKFPGLGGRQIWVRKDESWVCAGEGRGDFDLSGLPVDAGLVAVLLSSSEVGFLWDERGTPDQVELMLNELGSLAEGKA
ncbi:hypothetical protein BTA51_21690 [Hahella sp. CCB-MM4]|uniref:hypothetical protein n=1 Tax=Hahella sp. (strain CCB-MM4) TaxID=1926491 RepID=UPI000B9B3095|nr:hypothetical protein [Hahella sp. CCB-MM4]OZG71263.1 hypothetical protein BTA51_21690 [Hahella sp. CCB-MM4]